MSFTANSSGGAYKHRLAINEIPSHSHFLLDQTTDSQSGMTGEVEGTNHYLSRVSERADPKLRYWWSNTLSTGGGNPHNIVQPWISVFFWKRIN